MRRHGLIAEPVGELARDALCHAPCVDEHERGAVLRNEFGQARVNFRPGFLRHHRFKRRTRNLEAQIAPAVMPRVDDRDFRGGPAVRSRAGEKIGDGANRILRGGEADALQAVATQSREPLEREREMGAALVRRDGVDLVDDHRARGLEHRAPGLRAEQDVERFRRRHQDVRRTAAHAVALGGRACRLSGPRCGFRHRGVPSASAAPARRRAGLRGCDGYRSTVLSAATRRRPASRRRAAPQDPAARDRRSRT